MLEPLDHSFIQMIVNSYLTDMMVFLQTDLQEAWNNDQGKDLQIILTLISMITIFRTLQGFSSVLMPAVVFQ